MSLGTVQLCALFSTKWLVTRRLDFLLGKGSEILPLNPWSCYSCLEPLSSCKLRTFSRALCERVRNGEEEGEAASFCGLESEGSRFSPYHPWPDFQPQEFRLVKRVSPTPSETTVLSALAFCFQDSLRSSCSGWPVTAPLSVPSIPCHSE